MTQKDIEANRLRDAKILENKALFEKDSRAASEGLRALVQHDKKLSIINKCNTDNVPLNTIPQYEIHLAALSQASSHLSGSMRDMYTNEANQDMSKLDRINAKSAYVSKAGDIYNMVFEQLSHAHELRMEKIESRQHLQAVADKKIRELGYQHSSSKNNIMNMRLESNERFEALENTHTELKNTTIELLAELKRIRAKRK